MDKQREAFEAWAKKPPREFYLARHPDAAAWPGNYKDYHVECAWQAWQAAQQAQWKPIETAPRNGGRVLGASKLHDEWRIEEVWYCREYGFGGGQYGYPEFWMPLPQEPQP